MKTVARLLKKILMKITGYIYFKRLYKVICRYKNEKEIIEVISKDHNIPYTKLKWDYILSCCIYDIGEVSVYTILDFYNYSRAYRKKFAINIYKQKYNKNASQEEFDIFEDKNQFNKIFKKYVKRKNLYCEDKKEILNFINSVEEFIIKPLNLNGGKGVKVIKTAEIENKDKLINKLIQEKYMIEERLKQCQELESLNPTSINTVRPFLIKTNSNEIKMVGCVLRVGRLGANVDNASAGGVVYPVDTNTGKIIGQGVDRYGRKYMIHPNTDKFMIGFQIPKWDEIVKTVTEAMYKVKNVRTIAFDICVKENGIEFVEGNLQPAAETFQLDGPKLEFLEHYWNEKI